jgi:hypothetical protein
MTGNRENASVNLFSTQMGLNRCLQHNFHKQKHQLLQEKTTKPLAHKNFKKILDNPLAKIMSRRGKPTPLFKESDLQPATQPEEEQANDS